jgi:hypothetical protein
MICGLINSLYVRLSLSHYQPDYSKGQSAFSSIFAITMVVLTVCVNVIVFILAWKAYKGANSERYDVVIQSTMENSFIKVAYMGFVLLRFISVSLIVIFLRDYPVL